MARDRAQVQTDFLDDFIRNNEIDVDEFYVALARFEDHPMLENVKPHLMELRDGPDKMMSGKLPQSYLGIRADYVGDNKFGGRDEDVQEVFDELATEDIQFTGRSGWVQRLWREIRLGENTTRYVHNEVVISNISVPVHVKVKNL